MWYFNLKCDTAIIVEYIPLMLELQVVSYKINLAMDSLPLEGSTHNSWVVLNDAGTL